jgi:hypothetical protein
MQKTEIVPSKPVRVPGPDHPITIEANPARVVVTVAGRVVADSVHALTLRGPPGLLSPAGRFDRRARAGLKRPDRAQVAVAKDEHGRATDSIFQSSDEPEGGLNR